MAALATDSRLAAHVERLGADHPPIDLRSVDYTVRRPDVVARRFGGVLDYMARAELEVERNVLELTAMLPHPPEIDRIFYRDVWGPQELHHGLILDELRMKLGFAPVPTDLTRVSAKLRVLGLVAEHEAIQDVVRMLYYVTGMTTERSALLAYHRLQDGLVELGEKAIAATVITPIRRQEPGHYAYYEMSARRLWAQLASWQRWLTRKLRALSFTPVGATNRDQLGDVGEMMLDLDIPTADDAAAFAGQVARVEAELFTATADGLTVPAYIVKSFQTALTIGQSRRAAGAMDQP